MSGNHRNRSPLSQRTVRLCRRYFQHAAMLAIATAAVTGCAALKSEAPSLLEADGRAPEGLHYYLPKALVDLTLSADEGSASFKVALTNTDPANAITWVADKSHQYYMRHDPLPQYSDNISVTLSPKGFLSNVKANTTDETVEIIGNLAKIAGALDPGLESATSTANPVRLTNVVIDPSNPADIARATRLMNDEVRTFARAQKAQNCARAGDDKAAGFILDVKRRALCQAYTAVLRDGPHVSLGFEPLHGLGSKCHARTSASKGGYARSSHQVASVPEKDADCAAGICYRPAAPHELCMRAGKVVSRMTMIVPNGMPAVEIDLKRAFLVNKTQSITFDPTSGLLTEMIVKKDSEILALSSLPLAVIDGLAEGVKLRYTIVHSQLGQTTATKELVTAQTNLGKQRALLESAASLANATPGATSYSSVLGSGSTPALQSSGTPFDRLKTVN